MADKPSTVQVEIFGQTYSVKAGVESGYVEQLAAHVDREMKEVSRATGAVDSVRIAVMAALNIADEYYQLRARLQDADEALQRRARDLARTLGAVVDEA
jgi:cell division protein ZapA